MMSFSPDTGLQSWTSLMIDMVERKSLQSQKKWKLGQPLSLLFVGYTGSRNTGADVRVTEMIRQIQHVLGKDQSNLSIVTVNPEGSKNYFEDVTQFHIPKVFPPFLYKNCPKFDGVIACEGSMFKSKFADALSTLMAGALGMANAQDKLSVGYGAEAGHMNPSLEKFVKKQCQKSLVICRNQESQDILNNLNIRTSFGTDTAWTFAQPPAELGEKILRDHGWDGKKPIVAICPIDPFCWPVKPSVTKTLQRYLLGQNKETHYESIYFHDINQKKKEKFQTYIQSISNALARFEQDHSVFPILVGMEKLDRKACIAINERRENKLPMFISDEYDIHEMLAILHQSHMLISSRFHAIVCSMSGLVPSAGITMDERIHNLLTTRNDTDLILKVDEDDLEGKIYQTLCKLEQNRDAIIERIGTMIPGEIKKMGQMGIDFANEVVRIYPEFTPAVTSSNWEDYLPSLSEQTKKILEKYA